MGTRRKAEESAVEKPKRGRPKAASSRGTPKKGRPRKPVYEKAVLKDGPDGHFVPLDEFFGDFSWEPPAVKVVLNTFEMQYFNAKMKPIRTENLFAGSKVEISGEFDSIHVNVEGIEKELEDAINEVIRRRTRIPVAPRGTSMKYIVSPTEAIDIGEKQVPIEKMDAVERTKRGRGRKKNQPLPD